MKLSQAQIDQFRRDGFLVVENILSDADLNPMIGELSEWIDARAKQLHAEGKIKDLHADAPFERRYALLQAQCQEFDSGIDIMHMRGERIFEFLRHPKLMETLAGLIGGEIICNPIQHLRPKVPTQQTKGKNKEVIPWHQDHSVTWEEADASDIVTCWVALVDATPENGCMLVMPGVHKRGELKHIEGATIDPAEMPKVEPVRAAVRRGGAVLMSKYTPHCSTDNVSNGVRWSIDLRYQKTGTPTGRPFYPSFVTHSESNPSSVLTDHAKWANDWVTALENAKGVQWHRTTPKDKRIPAGKKLVAY